MTLELKPAPVRRRCMGRHEAFDISEYAPMLKRPVSSLVDFTHWASLIMGHGMHFLVGTYEHLGVAPRPNWVFWSRVSSPLGEAGVSGEAIFTAHRVLGGWRFGLHFYGSDNEFHTNLAACVLHTTVGETESGHILGRPLHGKDEGMAVTWFEVLRPDDKGHYTVGLYPAAQFD